jgi:hypothetical protein
MPSNTYGRQVVVPLTNKSGGGVIAGDVVIIDTTNNAAFTTTTSAAFTGTVGIAQETIASNGVGRVLTSGYAALINVNASVTRGYYGATHTVAKQAASAGATRSAGCFVQFLTGGTTPDGVVYPVDLAGATGNVATDNIWAAAGDLAVGTGSHTAAVLTKGAAGTVPIAGASTLAYAFPPGYEFSYVENTSPVTVSATSEAAADTCVTAAAFAGDGSTIILIEFYAAALMPGWTAVTDSLSLWLYDGASSIGQIAFVRSITTNQANDRPCYVARRLTPSNASHTYSIRASRQDHNGSVYAGAGGTNAAMPMFIRITKV